MICQHIFFKTVADALAAGNYKNHTHSTNNKHLIDEVKIQEYTNPIKSNFDAKPLIGPRPADVRHKSSEPAGVHGKNVKIPILTEEIKAPAKIQEQRHPTNSTSDVKPFIGLRPADVKHEQSELVSFHGKT